MKPRSRKKSIIIGPLLLLAGGALVNVVVASLCRFQIPKTAAKAVPIPPNQTVDTLGWDCIALTATERTAVGADDFAVMCYTYSGAIGQNVFQTISTQAESGWPVRSFRGVMTLPFEKSPQVFGAIEQVTTFHLNNFQVQDTFLIPFMPLWPGFAINTVFYASILWVLLFVPGCVKRALRRRRGLCPACAYPIGTNSVCTECGAAVTAKERAH